MSTEFRKTKDGLFYHDSPLSKVLEIRAEDVEEGVVSAYLTEWDTVDSWNTSFKKGSFKKSFESRGAEGLRLIWNHTELAGKIIECREDDYGPLVVCKFNLETDAGKKAYAHVRAKDVNCFSFGFNTVKDAWVGQVRQISEVDMREAGPVIFEANGGAKITEIRSEERSTDFDETQAARELNAKGWQLISSFECTIDDIYYSYGNPVPTPEEIIAQVDTAIAKFHTAYISWLQEYYGQPESREGKPPCERRNTLQSAVNSLDTKDLVSTTALTSEEITTLAKGCLLPIESRGKLLVASPVIAKAHQETRSTVIKKLCDELRHSGLTTGEIERVDALLERSRKPSEIDEAIGVLQEIRSRF